MPKKHAELRDPVTGDPLTRGEWVSWRLQSVIRNWWMLGSITAITLTCWVYTAVRIGLELKTGPIAVLTWWNLGASYMALLIEGTVGIAMFSQTRRDALHIRATHQNTDHLETLCEQQAVTLKHLQALLEHHGIDPDSESLKSSG